MAGSSAESRSQLSWRLVASTIIQRAACINSVGGFSNVHGFQGIDLVWEYPSSVTLEGSINDSSGLR